MNEPHPCKTCDALVGQNKDANLPKQLSMEKRICKAVLAGGSTAGAGCCGVLLADVQLLCTAGPAEISALELVAVVVSPDWQQLSGVCNRYRILLMAG